MSNLIYTGEKFFGKKLFIESFDNKEADEALKTVFHDHYHKSAPLRMAREDVQMLLNFQRAASRTDGSL